MRHTRARYRKKKKKKKMFTRPTHEARAAAHAITTRRTRDDAPAGVAPFATPTRNAHRPQMTDVSAVAKHRRISRRRPSGQAPPCAKKSDSRPLRRWPALPRCRTKVSKRQNPRCTATPHTLRQVRARITHDRRIRRPELAPALKLLTPPHHVSRVTVNRST